MSVIWRADLPNAKLATQHSLRAPTLISRYSTICSTQHLHRQYFVVLSCDLINTFPLLHSNLLYSFAFPLSVSASTADSPCLELPISATALRCILTHFIYTPTDPNRDLGIILPFNRTTLQSQVQAPLLNRPLPPKRMTPFRDTQQMRSATSKASGHQDTLEKMIHTSSLHLTRMRASFKISRPTHPESATAAVLSNSTAMHTKLGSYRSSTRRRMRILREC